MLASDTGWQGNQASGRAFEIKSVALVEFIPKIAYFQVVTACNLLNFEWGAGNMNPHAFQICAALLRWRGFKLAEILVISKHINCLGIFCQGTMCALHSAGPEIATQSL